MQLVAIMFLSALLSSAWAKLPELDAVYFGTLRHNGGVPLVPSYTGQVLVIARFNGVAVAESAVPLGQSGYTLKIPMDDGKEPRLQGTVRAAEQVRVFVRNTGSGAEHEVTQTKTTPFSISAVKGDLQLYDLSVAEDLGVGGTLAEQYAAWKRAYPQLSQTSDDSGLDFDGDSMTNLQEYLADTDPTAAGSTLRIRNFIRKHGVNSINFGPIRLSRAYTVYTTESLSAPIWVKVGELRPTTDADLSWFDHTATDKPNLFYRVQVNVQ